MPTQYVPAPCGIVEVGYQVLRVYTSLEKR